jgi:energy-coupling factor transporter transmembrane protein EcfT
MAFSYIQHGWAQQVDPRTKLLLVLLVLLALFASSVAGVAVLFCWALLAWLVGGGLGRSSPIMRSVVVLVIMTIIANSWWGPPPYLQLTDWLRLSRNGLWRGALLAARLIVMTITAQALTQSTSPLALSQALHWFLWPLRRIHATVPDLPMLLAIGSRFIPELQADARRLSAMRRIRLANLAHQGTVTATLRQRWSMLAQTGRELLVPLLRLSFHRAGTLGDALALRGYSPDRPPTLPGYRLKRADVLAWVITLGTTYLAVTL